MGIDKEKTLVLLDKANAKILPYCMLIPTGRCQELCPRYNLCQFLLDLQENIREMC